MEILISGSGDFEGLEEIYSFLLSKTTSPVAQAFFFQIVKVPHLKPQRRLESSNWSGEHRQAVWTKIPLSVAASSNSPSSHDSPDDSQQQEEAPSSSCAFVQ